MIKINYIEHSMSNAEDNKSNTRYNQQSTLG